MASNSLHTHVFMRHLVLLVVFAACSSFMAQGQCTIDPFYADSTFGMWPNPEMGIDTGTIGQPYVQVMQLKVPMDGGDIDPDYTGVGIHKIELASVNGLPDGIEYDCDDGADCEWFGGEQGCIRLFGAPEEAGVFSVDVVVTGYSTFLPNTPLVNYPFEGLEMVVNDTTSSIRFVTGKALELNTAVQREGALQLKFQAARTGNVTVQLFDLLGKPVSSDVIAARAGNNNSRIDLAATPAGVYFVSIQQDNQRDTKRLVITQR